MANLPYTRGNINATIAIVGEAPGADEEQAFQRGATETAFVGKSGNELDRLLREAGIDPASVYFTNVFKERPDNNNVKIFDSAQLARYTAILHKEIDSLPNLTTIVPVGNIALNATAVDTITWYKKPSENDAFRMNKVGGIGNYRGSILASRFSDHKVIPTFHPAFLFKRGHAGSMVNWRYRPVIVHDLKRVKEESKTRELNLPNHVIHIEPTYAQVMEFLDDILAKKDPNYRISTDIENLGRQIFCLGIAISENEAMCIPFARETGDSYFDLDDECRILFKLHDVLSHTDQIGQFYFHDAYYYHHYGLIEARERLFTRCKVDCFTAHTYLYGEFPHSLGFITSIYTRVPYYKPEGRQWSKRTDPDPRPFWLYNGKDCIVTYEAGMKLEQELISSGSLDFYHRYYTDLFPYLLQTGIRGIRVDEISKTHSRAEYKKLWLKMQTDLQESLGLECPLHLSETNKQWKDKANYINVSSYKQIQKIFKEKGNITLPSTGERELRKAKKKYPEHADNLQKILSIRSIRTIKSSFLDKELGHDGRFHFLLKTATETGRLASSEDPMGFGGNAQNIPDGRRDGDLRGLPSCRAHFIPDPGKVMIYADLSQAEARVVAYLIESIRMIEMFEQVDKCELCECGSGKLFGKCCGDVHKIMAASLFSVLLRKDISPTQVTPAQRFLGKKGRHAANYLIGKHTLAEAIGLSPIQSERILKAIYKESPELPRWHNEVQRELVRYRRLENPFGRIRRFFGRPTDHATLREGVAFIPQSTVPDIVNMAYREIASAGIQVLNQTHDALLVQVWEKDVEEGGLFVRNAMERPFEIHGRNVIIPCEMEVGLSWDSKDLVNWIEWQSENSTTTPTMM